MPTYEYVCDGCGHGFDQFQMMSAAPLRKCPKCGKLKLRRLIGTGAGIIFKGSGFYETDYRGEGYKKAMESEKNGSCSSTDTQAKTETKTEAKAEDKPQTKAEVKADKKAASESGAKKTKAK